MQSRGHIALECRLLNKTPSKYLNGEIVFVQALPAGVSYALKRKSTDQLSITNCLHMHRKIKNKLVLNMKTINILSLYSLNRLFVFNFVKILWIKNEISVLETQSGTFLKNYSRLYFAVLEEEETSQHKGTPTSHENKFYVSVNCLFFVEKLSVR